MMIRSVLALWVSSLLSAPLLAQRPAVEWNQARQQAVEAGRCELRSGLPKEIAWGAFRAAEYRLTDLVPDLIAVLESPPAAERLERGVLIAAVLDAAVQLNASLPAAVLRSYWTEWPVHTAILMALTREAERDAILLELLPASTGFQWPAAANLLLTTKPHGFAAALLTNLLLDLPIGVADFSASGRTGVVAGGNAVGLAVRDGIGFNPPGFPPFAAYGFEYGPHTGHVVLASGPRTVYYSRTVTYEYQFGVSQTFSNDANRLDYLAALANLTKSEAVRGLRQPSVSVAWRGTDELEREVAQARNEMARRYQQLVSALVVLKHLSEREAEQFSKPDIRVRFIDVRTDKSEPLPSVQ